MLETKLSVSAKVWSRGSVLAYHLSLGDGKTTAKGLRRQFLSESSSIGQRLA
jgi:hypothetical protein